MTKNIRLAFLTSVFVASSAFSNEPATQMHSILDKEPGNWGRGAMWAEQVIAHLADDLRSATDEAIVLLEDWDEANVFVITDVPRPTDYQGIWNASCTSLQMNPEMPLFSIGTDESTISGVLDQMVIAHQSLKWSFDEKYRIINIARKDLTTDQRWPLNRPLNIPSSKSLTFEEGRLLLEREFGMDCGKDARLLGVPSDEQGIIIWPASAENQSDATEGAENIPTVRDLVKALVKHGHKSGFWYHAQIHGHFDPRLGHDGLKDRDKLEWVLLRKTGAQLTHGTE